MRQARRHRHQGLDIWPGFVDAMSTLLMVIIFVLMTFVLAQFYLSDALTSKDSDITSLSQKMSELRHKIAAMTDHLAQKETTIQQTQATLAETQNSVSALTQTIQEREDLLTALTAEKEQESKAFEAQRLSFQTHDQEQEALLNAQKNLIADQTQQLEETARIITEKTQMLTQLSQEKEQLMQDVGVLKVAHLEATEKIAGLEQTHAVLSQEFTALQKENLQFKGNMMAFRSEFFGILQKAVGDRSDMRVVGDRFVFQSEVLFGLGSSELGAQGKKQLDLLAAALREISNKIPTSIRWILRVDGHTDQLPISTDRFPSNWELSTARAMSVVHYLISRGIDPKHLVAAGFGEHQPLEDGKDAKAQARNRRIEFKLDQR